MGFFFPALTLSGASGLALPLRGPRLEPLAGLRLVLRRWRLLQQLERSTLEAQSLADCSFAPRQHVWLVLRGATGCDEVTEELMHLHPGTLTLLWEVRDVAAKYT